MAEYQVHVTDELVLSVDLPPNLPRLRGVEVSFVVDREEDLADAVTVLGFDAAKVDPTKSCMWRWALPVTCDGEDVANGSVSLDLSEQLAERSEPAMIPALVRLRNRQRAGEPVDAS